MELIQLQLDLIGQWPMLFALIFGLIVGSFLNVVVHRLPTILFGDAIELPPTTDRVDQSSQPDEAAPDQTTDSEKSLLDLVVPRSRCPQCSTQIAWYDNIPILSYLWLKGRCRACRTAIGWRYPLIELLTGLLFVACLWRFGASYTALFCCLFCAWLVAIAAIDWRHMLIPDLLSLSGMWLGLLVSCTTFGLVDPVTAIIGAAGGYLLLYIFYLIYLGLTGKAGLGYGDFKLMAMFGAWLGYHALPAILFFASIVGSVYGLWLYSRSRQSQPFAFGPWLICAAWLLLFFPQFNPF